MLAGAGDDLIDVVTADDGSAENALGDAGNDTLQAGAGDDTILFNVDGGQDAVRNDADVLRFVAGFGPAALYLSRVGNDLVLRFRNSTNQVTVLSRYDPRYAYVQTAAFADGTTVDLTRDDLPIEISGTGGADSLSGGSYPNVIYGKAGNDTIGGIGNDTLYGGDGIDMFRYAAPSDSLVGIDTIMDFDPGGGERIDLSVIDAVPGGTDNPFTFIGNAAFTHTAGELSYDSSYYGTT